MVKNKRKSVAPVVAEHHSRPRPPAAMAQEVDKTKVFGRTDVCAGTAEAGRQFASTDAISPKLLVSNRDSAWTAELCAFPLAGLRVF
jgi:hypothetical protein